MNFTNLPHAPSLDFKNIELGCDPRKVLMIACPNKNLNFPFHMVLCKGKQA
jgi:hypothetical protein